MLGALLSQFATEHRLKTGAGFSKALNNVLKNSDYDTKRPTSWKKNKNTE